MAICDNKIKANIQPDCLNPIYSGHRAAGWIFNYDDVEVDTDAGEITAIRLKKGAKGYPLNQLGDKPYKTNKTLKKGANFNRWDTLVTLIGLKVDALFTAQVIDPLMTGGRVIVAIEHEYESISDFSRTYQSPFEFFGIEQGLRIAEGSGREEYNADTDGGYLINLAETGANYPSYWLMCTNREEGRAEIDGLLNPVG